MAETMAKREEPPMHATMNEAKMSPNGGADAAVLERAGVQLNTKIYCDDTTHTHTHTAARRPGKP